MCNVCHHKSRSVFIFAVNKKTGKLFSKETGKKSFPSERWKREKIQIVLTFKPKLQSLFYPKRGMNYLVSDESEMSFSLPPRAAINALAKVFKMKCSSHPFSRFTANKNVSNESRKARNFLSP